MSYYSIVAIEMKNDVSERLINYLRRMDPEEDIFHYPDRVIKGEDTTLFLFEWNRAPYCSRMFDEIKRGLGLAFDDFNVTVNGEMENDRQFEGGLDRSYSLMGKEIARDGEEYESWHINDDEYGKSTIVFDGEEIRIDYRLTEDEMKEMEEERRIHDKEDNILRMIELLESIDGKLDRLLSKR